MLMGCCKLLKLGSCKAILEGDSYAAIQWGSGKSYMSLAIGRLGRWGSTYRAAIAMHLPSRVKRGEWSSRWSCEGRSYILIFGLCSLFLRLYCLLPCSLMCCPPALVYSVMFRLLSFWIKFLKLSKYIYICNRFLEFLLPHSWLESAGIGLPWQELWCDCLVSWIQALPRRHLIFYAPVSITLEIIFLREGRLNSGTSEEASHCCWWLTYVADSYENVDHLCCVAGLPIQHGRRFYCGLRSHGGVGGSLFRPWIYVFWLNGGSILRHYLSLLLFGYFEKRMAAVLRINRAITALVWQSDANYILGDNFKEIPWDLSTSFG